MIVALLMIVLGGVMVWKGVEYFRGGYSKQAPQDTVPAPASSSTSTRAPAWQQYVLIAFDSAAKQAKSGDVTGAEKQVDEAVAEMEVALVRARTAPNNFFSSASAGLDQVLKARPDAAASGTNDHADSVKLGQLLNAGTGRLFEHVTQARTELAAMRSSQEPLPPGVELASDAEARARESAARSSPAANGMASPVDLPADAPVKLKLKLPAGHVSPDGPRTLSANALLDAKTLGGDFLDATLMPDAVEILLPPESRQFSDNVRVENLTIAGASQTLDGIHWRNVTFIKTRLRYEDGPLDLQNVRFVRCTFGFPSDARGAKIATAIALGQTTVMIQ